MTAAWIVGFLALLGLITLVIADRAFRARFVRQAEAARKGARSPGAEPLAEEDLRDVPEPLARWLRWSGALGERRIGAVRVLHGGRFKADATRPWMPIRGEYVITASPPSFHWYGRMRVVPGLHVAAIDSYSGGRGRMLVKALSALTLADAHSPQTDQSAFGRCLVELTLAPTFFLDPSFVRCEQTGPHRVRCTVADGHLSAGVDLLVHLDGSLDRVVVDRPYDRGDGRSTLERFTGRCSGAMSRGGRRLTSRVDGYWNLPEGDLHFAAFELERVTFE